MSSLASHSLHVAVELTGSGHHPAAEGAPGNLPIIGGDYWVDLTEGEKALDLASFPTNVVRIRAADLREAQLERARIRAAVAEEGRDPDSVAVLVDLEILIAPEARSARKELAQLDSALTSPRGSRFASLRRNAFRSRQFDRRYPSCRGRRRRYVAASRIASHARASGGQHHSVASGSRTCHTVHRSRRGSRAFRTAAPSAHACVLIVTDCICVQVEQRR